MHIRDLFTVPEDQKITDKAFSRVLISSVLSIILLLTCLTGTTWAWFMVDIENTDNVIAIATITMDATVLQENGTTVTRESDGSYALLGGTYTLQLQAETNATGSQRTIYVLLTLTQMEETTQYYVPFSGGQTAGDTPIVVNTPAIASFSVCWSLPDTALPIDTLAPITE